MKNVVISVLISSLLFATWRTAITLVWFTTQQASLIENACINRDRPELNCQATCVLRTKLADEIPSETTTLPVPNLDDKPLQLFILAAHQFTIDLVILPQRSLLATCTLFLTKLLVADIFHPPRY